MPNHLFSLAGKVALVTGTSSGIGLGVLAKQNALPSFENSHPSAPLRSL